MQNADYHERTVYHISPLRLWLGTGIFLTFAIFWLILACLDFKDFKAQAAFLLIGIFLLICAGLMYLLLRYSRLVLSPVGITLYQIGYRLETPWRNVAYLNDVPGAQGLILHHPMDCRGASMLRLFRRTHTGAGVRFYNPEQIQLISERRFIPLEAFAYRLKHGRLRDELQRHVPSLPAGSTQRISR